MKPRPVKVPREEWELEWTLFDKDYSLPGSEIQYQQCDGNYVGDSIGEKEIGQWDKPLDISRYNYAYCDYIRFYPPYCLPVFISAQTGKGKNYFISNTLRQYARERNQKILYISNRVALGYQQKKDLASLTKTFLGATWEYQETFENVTVLTYQRLLDCYYDKEKAIELKKFTYVVLDECHFFYSDAFFNPFTWEVLSNTVELFQNSVRIYLSATLDDVIEPIRYFEGLYLGKQFSKAGYYAASIGQYAQAYHFPRNYSNYKVSFFSHWQQLFSKMVLTEEKWLVFVTSKSIGKKLKSEIDEYTKKEEMPNLTAYIDSDTRNSDKNEDRILWDSLLRTGKFESQILITTSVLDNGFSIKDAAVKHIVLFTHDRTEFLQELGRFRLPDEETEINLYIQKYTANAHSNRKTLFDRYSKMLESIDGDGTEFCQGNICETIKGLWKDSDGQQLRNCFYFKEKDGLLEPVLNEMARWRIKRLGQQINDYEKLLEQEKENAPTLYKARWLDKKLSECGDFDFDEHQAAIKKMKELLDSQIGKTLVEKSQQFNDFSLQFAELFRIIAPGEIAENRGNDRKNNPMGDRAINTRLKHLHKFGLFYSLEAVQNQSKGKKQPKEYQISPTSQATAEA